MGGGLKYAFVMPRKMHSHIFWAGLMVMQTHCTMAAEQLDFIVAANVVLASCSVVAGDEEQTIKMGDIDVNKLESSGKSDITFFNIRLDKCTEATKLAKVTFNSQYSDGDGWFYPADGQDDWGYKLGLTDSQGVHIPLGVGQDMQISGSDNSLEFGVMLAKANGILHMGDFSAIATATISYE